MFKSFPLVRAGCYCSTRWLINKITGSEHLPRKGSVIITPNHSSLIDGVIITTLFNILRLSPCHTIVQQESFKDDFFGYLLRCAKCIPVDRQSKESIAEMFGLALAYLGKGEQVMIFPEGHLNNGETLRLPRPGAALLALESGAPVLPVGLRGTRNIYRLGEKFNYLSRAQVHYGKLIDTTGLSRLYQRAAAEERKRLIEDLSLRIMLQISELSGMRLHKHLQRQLQARESAVGWER